VRVSNGKTEVSSVGFKGLRSVGVDLSSWTGTGPRDNQRMRIEVPVDTYPVKTLIDGIPFTVALKFKVQTARMIDTLQGLTLSGSAVSFAL